MHYFTISRSYINSMFNIPFNLMTYKHPTNDVYNNLFEASLEIFSPSILDFVNITKFSTNKSNNTFDSNKDLYVYKDIHSNSNPSSNVFSNNPNTTEIFGQDIIFPSDKIVLLYLPFFSNCDELGVHITMRDLLNHQSCTLYDTKQSEAFSFYSLFAEGKSDTCDYVTTCFYDERLDVIYIFYLFNIS